MCVLGWLCGFLVQFLGGLLAVREPAGCVHACLKWQTSGFPLLAGGTLRRGSSISLVFINFAHAIGIIPCLVEVDVRFAWWNPPCVNTPRHTRSVRRLWRRCVVNKRGARWRALSRVTVPLALQLCRRHRADPSALQDPRSSSHYRIFQPPA